MNKRFSLYIPLFLTVVFIAGVGIGNFLGERSLFSRNPQISPSGNKMNTILHLIEKAYVDSVDIAAIIEKSIPGVLENLDPHTSYIPARDMQVVEEEMQGNFSGIGVQFNIMQDTIMIVDVISGGPSATLGILAGDRIVMVNDSLVAGTGIKNEDVLKLLRGKKGTHVKVSIQRKGFRNILDFDIVRGEIPIYSVDVSYMIDQETGFIKVSRFAETTYAEFTDAMKKLDKQGASRMIIDLRGNPGGYLNAVIRMVNDFLEKGDTILYTQGKAQPKKVFSANSLNAWAGKQIFVLIDEFSASASEIFAGAIQDNDRGIIIGRRSFGKGLVQEQIPFSDGSAVRLTVARYFTPSGRSIQKSYENGNEKYFADLINRMVHGEFEAVDSIHFADSLKYQTRKGRTVYGGGGIMPDIFVPADTSGRSDYFEKLYQKMLISQYAFQYTDQHREELAEMTTAQEIGNYLEKAGVLNSFISYAASRGVPADAEGIRASGHIINTQLKAYIARNMIGDEGFYPIIQQIDKTLLKAIEISRQNLLVENVGK
ncbi:MAG TPA: S41 family peptidase [Prolixibacteraceae bacterium]|jgi:carboxyl-terminal processing protease|nr:PDZ domain-containing protein [Prolixibacteraceae bacterium]HOF55842.1 S41 family peptidase [Prolixibacteraceae bacterium]HOS00263.1 S41 family peptidase [Prolixibacteraceae bacterium]HOS89283.1 S41 family peptidase [Prolixibacteraceae bacterium]HPL45666.1 S41 family peptidase [Prolixibacteraceae bacterium]